MVKQQVRKERIKRSHAPREIRNPIASEKDDLCIQAGVSIVCGIADASGELCVEMSYEGDPATVLYLLECAIEKISDEAFPLADECEECPTTTLSRADSNRSW